MLEIRRGKALALIVESATVTDTDGNPVELAHLQRGRDHRGPDRRGGRRDDERAPTTTEPTDAEPSSAADETPAPALRRAGAFAVRLSRPTRRLSVAARSAVTLPIPARCQAHAGDSGNPEAER